MFEQDVDEEPEVCERDVMAEHPLPFDPIRVVEGGWIVTNTVPGGPASERAFFIRIVASGERYGLGHRLVNAGGPLVEFYDQESKDDAAFIERAGGHRWGQFVARYGIREMLAHREGWGLDLEGGVDVWMVDWAGMDALVPVLRSLNLV